MDSKVNYDLLQKKKKTFKIKFKFIKKIKQIAQTFILRNYRLAAERKILNVILKCWIKANQKQTQKWKSRWEKWQVCICNRQI